MSSRRIGAHEAIGSCPKPIHDRLEHLLRAARPQPRHLKAVPARNTDIRVAERGFARHGLLGNRLTQAWTALTVAAS